MTEGFLSSIEAQAKSETERIINELQALKLDANQVITVLNALKLEVPKELRELAPIEVVPPVHKLPPKKDSTRSTLEANKVRQDKSRIKYQTIRVCLLEMLVKGPVLKNDVLKQFETGEFSRNLVQKTFTHMRKAGEVDTRTVGFQGPTEWFLPSRPVTLETLRDEVTKTEGEVPFQELKDKLGFKDGYDLEMMLYNLKDHGILAVETGKYVYKKPKGTPVKDAVPRKGNGSRRSMPIGGTGRRAKLSASKEVQQILAKAEAAGAQTKKQGNDHIRVELGDKVVVLSSSPGDNNRANREKIKDLGINV